MEKETKQLTNEDLIHDLMNYSKYGMLSQAFIIQAISYYTANVLEKSDELIKEEEENEKNGKISLISSKAWVGIAKDISDRMDYFYKNHKLK